MLGCSPARDTEASYVAYGHSILTDPWGTVIAQLDEREGLLSTQIDLERVDDVRRQIPLQAFSG
jgi:predicted amidohydrolase